MAKTESKPEKGHTKPDAATEYDNGRSPVAGVDYDEPNVDATPTPKPGEEPTLPKGDVDDDGA